jgi:hypothetical protein
MGEPRFAASSMPMRPPIEVPTQSTLAASSRAAGAKGPRSVPK